MKYSKEEVANATIQLKNHCKPGTTVYCVLRKVSRSGMSRRIDFYAIDIPANKHSSPRLQYLTGWMNIIFGNTRSDNGMCVNGCGMDMGFHMVDALAGALYGRDARGLGKNLRHEWV